jgi:methionyl-tRNA formyltransferase
LLENGHDLALVLTQPDRPAGRGMRPTASAVKQLALGRGLEVFQPDSLNTPEALARLRNARADVLIVAAYGHLLPAAALQSARHGALNIHASLLPRWRGAAPIQRALLAGDAETGITIMQMDAGLDTGPMLSKTPLPISPDETAGTLHDRLAALGARAIVEALDALATGDAKFEVQPETGATYARKISANDAVIEWSRPSVEIERQMRALTPGLGARSSLRGEPIKLWRATCIESSGPTGEILEAGAQGIVIACGQGALSVSELQRSGGKRLSAADFLRGFPIQAGEKVGATR